MDIFQLRAFFPFCFRFSEVLILCFLIDVLGLYFYNFTFSGTYYFILNQSWYWCCVHGKILSVKSRQCPQTDSMFRSMCGVPNKAGFCDVSKVYGGKYFFRLQLNRANSPITAGMILTFFSVMFLNLTISNLQFKLVSDLLGLFCGYNAVNSYGHFSYLLFTFSSVEEDFIWSLVVRTTITLKTTVPDYL